MPNKEKYFTHFVQGKDTIVNPSKEYKERIVLKNTSIEMGLSQNEYIYTGSVPNYPNALLTAFSGSTTSHHNQYNMLEALLRSERGVMTGSWAPLNTKSIDKFAVYSFANNAIGDALYREQFELGSSIYGDGYGTISVRKPTSEDKFDIAPRWRTQNSQFGVLKVMENNFVQDVGLFFGQLGLVLFYGDANDVIPKVSNSIVLNDVQRVQRFNSETYFCRVTHQKYNASRNQSWREWNPALRSYIVSKDYTVITSIGLYDEENTLMAIGKLSQPVIKQRDSEALFSLVLQY